MGCPKFGPSFLKASASGDLSETKAWQKAGSSHDVRNEGDFMVIP